MQVMTFGRSLVYLILNVYLFEKIFESKLFLICNCFSNIRYMIYFFTFLRVLSALVDNQSIATPCRYPPLSSVILYIYFGTYPLPYPRVLAKRLVQMGWNVICRFPRGLISRLIESIFGICFNSLVAKYGIALGTDKTRRA